IGTVPALGRVLLRPSGVVELARRATRPAILARFRTRAVLLAALPRAIELSLAGKGARLSLCTRGRRLLAAPALLLRRPCRRTAHPGNFLAMATILAVAGAWNSAAIAAC